ncbi:hypothetical protein NQ318_022896, partial [Aromia moschata]
GGTASSASLTSRHWYTEYLYTQIKNESTFYLNGNVNNTQNVKYWSDTNPRMFREKHTQFPAKGGTQCEVVRLFRETHPDLPPLNQGTISKIEAQYRAMGHVRKVPSKRQTVVDDDTKLNLLLAPEENPITPARQLARDSNLNHKTVLKNT